MERVVAHDAVKDGVPLGAGEGEEVHRGVVGAEEVGEDDALVL